MKLLPSEPLDLVAEPENKLTMLTTSKYMSIFERLLFRDGKMSLKFLEEELRSEFQTFQMLKYSPIFEEVKKKIQRLVEAGICPEKLGGIRYDYGPERTENEVPALVLIMDDLEIGFLVCLIPMALSVIAFICEVAGPRIKTLAINMRDLLTFLFLMRAVANVRLSSY